MADAEIALAFDTTGVPRWWPERDPRTLARYAPADRRRWFLETIAGQLRGQRDAFLVASIGEQRRMVASTIIEIEATWAPEDIPPPDFR